MPAEPEGKAQLVRVQYFFLDFFFFGGGGVLLNWLIGSVSAFQCVPDLIPGWGSDAGAVSEKGLSPPV